MKPRLHHRTEAIVLRSRDYGESDRIITFYTLHFGKVVGIAKGAKRSKRRFANTLESFSCLDLLFSNSHSDTLAFIDEGTVINHFTGISGDLNATLFASYLLDITDHFTVEQKKNTALYYSLKGFLEIFDRGHRTENLLRFYEMRLLRHAGFEPALDKCLACKAPLGSKTIYYFSLRDGGLSCSDCVANANASPRLSVGTIRSLLLGRDMEEEKLCRLVLSPQSARESLAFLGQFIEHLLGREVKSLRVIRDVSESMLGNREC